MYLHPKWIVVLSGYFYKQLLHALFTCDKLNIMKQILSSKKHPRNNLPGKSAKKRTESNFVLAFGRAYAKDVSEKHEDYSVEMAREVQVHNFGIADLVSVLITPSQKFSLHAFEMKMNDWRKALAQAYRYRYFADSSCVVLPPDEAIRAKKSISIFRSVNVGLLSFDKKESCIESLYSPRKGKPLSANAYNKAIDLLSEKLNFCQSFK